MGLVCANPDLRGPLLTPPALKVPKGYPGHDLSKEQRKLAKELRGKVQALFEDGSLSGLPVKGEKDWALDLVCLVRYLKASKFDVIKATGMICKTLNWRRAFKPSEITPEDVEAEAVDGKAFFSGYDLEGRPVLHIGSNQVSSDADRYLRFIVFLLESGTRMMPKGQCQLTLVLDCENVGLFSLNSPVIYMQALEILSSHYPEALGRVFVVNSNWILLNLFRIVSPLMDPVTLEKVRFIETKGATRTKLGLEEWIAPSQLPVCFGGNHQFEYVHGQHWPEFCERIAVW
ncbi:CRAL-TRIO domain-containing protein [Chytriomyces sp. MP71]|nr:CRAL-TRIO domain-containing protein [Chytriomyces sp. MP71]